MRAPHIPQDSDPPLAFKTPLEGDPSGAGEGSVREVKNARITLAERARRLAHHLLGDHDRESEQRRDASERDVLLGEREAGALVEQVVPGQRRTDDGIARRRNAGAQAGDVAVRFEDRKRDERDEPAVLDLRRECSRGASLTADAVAAVPSGTWEWACAART